MNAEQLEILTSAEAERLATLESVVERGVQTFIEVGEALAEIRDSKLYRQSHSSFEVYLRDRWGMGRAHGYRLIDAYHVTELLSPTGDSSDGDPHQPTNAQPSTQERQNGKKKLPVPRNERVARRLLQSAERDKTRATEIWGTTVERYGADATEEQVAEVAADVDATRPPIETTELAKALRDGAAAMLRAHKTRDPRDARKALAVLRDAARRLPSEYSRLDGLTR